MPLLQYKDFTKTEFEQSHGGRPCLVQGVPEAEGWLCREKWRSEGRFLKHYADMHIPVTEMAPLMGKTRKLNVSLEQYVAYAASNEVALSLLLRRFVPQSHLACFDPMVCEACHMHLVWL